MLDDMDEWVRDRIGKGYRFASNLLLWPKTNPIRFYLHTDLVLFYPISSP
jgi:hypothetical protein